jgi:hypothetical protein
MTRSREINGLSMGRPTNELPISCKLGRGCVFAECGERGSLDVTPDASRRERVLLHP